jgi:hypothetical protein
MKLMKHFCTTFIFAILFLGGTAYASVSRSAQSKIFSVAASSSDELIVNVTPTAYFERFIDVDGKQMKQYDGSLSGWTSEPGKPSLPIVGILAAVPPGKIPVVDIIESKFDVIDKEEIAPAPSFTFNDNNEAEAQYHVDRNFYAAFNQFYPLTQYEVGEQAQLRDLSVVKILLYPMQYNPATKQLKRYSHFKIRIRFQQNLGKSVQAWQPVTGADPYFAPVYDGLVLNYKDASQWRGRAVRSAQSVTVDSTRAWFQTGRKYFRIPVIKEGVYHLSYTTLMNFAIDLSTITKSSIALYNKGKSVPLTVHPVDSAIQQSYLEFYGDRNHGALSFFNPYNDTNAYWLTWNDSYPSRYAQAALASSPADTVSWAINTLWNEQDLNYFFGVTQDDLLTPYDLPGKGWYWSDFTSSVTRIYPFTTDTVQRKTGIRATLRARFYGMTVCSGSGCVAPSRHRAFLYINRKLIDSVSWTQNTEMIYSGTFPDSILRKGLDTLRVTSKTWAASDSNISKFYLDWFEVTYPRPLISTTGTLKFTAAPTGKATTAYTINGIPGDSATIIDLTNGRMITNHTNISPTSFMFTDSVSVPRNYYIVKDSAKLIPDAMIQKTFADLRVNNTGADYVVITHPLFRSEADRLAQFRSAHDRLRAIVVDVQDIYDQFSFGLLDPTALRSFLKNTYYNWRHPSPTYAVFFGDATWDFKKNLSNSVMNNYVPSFGNPPSDNALVCFDSVYYYLPYMLAGRIPVKSLQEATSVVNKIIGYETPPLSDWSKTFLFITGGATANEKTSFNYYSDGLINKYVVPPPIGGLVDRVYKTSDAYVDGENKQLMQNYFQAGLGLVNFIGHSGGRVWGVDIGSPNDLQNTNGKLPFVSSVSCDVGFFSDPRSNVLSEDFLLTDNRGAIAVWAASSLGYATVGRTLMDKFLEMVTLNYARDLGLLTTLSRINFWVINNRIAAPLVVESLNLHPLIGDPATTFALSTYPDFEVSADNISLLNNPPIADSTVTLLVRVDNYGLTAGSPLLVSVKDSYTDEAGVNKGVADLVPPFYIPDFTQKDSFTVSWNVKGKPGSHIVTVTLDPLDSIAEARKDNNTAQQTFYIYRNTISIISPLPFRMVSSTTPTFTVTVPAGRDTTPLTYHFEVDTSAAFASPAKISSGTVTPGKVTASWTPSAALAQNRTYYWRAQNTASIGSSPKQGAWVSSSFQTTQSSLPTDTIVWRQSNKQFLKGNLALASVNDSGATLFRSDSTVLYARSLGFRGNTDHDYYSVVQINDVVALGHWWEDPYSYLAAWYNPLDGTYGTKGFNFLNPTGTSDMITYLNNIPNGDYVLLSAVWDAKQNATDSLLQQIRALGSEKIDSLLRGQSWMMISLKGTGKLVEVYNTTVAEGTVTLGNVFHLGKARVSSPPIGPAAHWGFTSFDINLPNANATGTITVLGMKNDTTMDTLMTVPAGTAAANLSAVNVLTYPRIKLSATLACTDGFTSPVLRRWDVHYLAPGDLAISAWSVTLSTDTIISGNALTTSATVYNIGYQSAAGAHLTCYLLEDTAQQFTSSIRTINTGSSRRINGGLTVTGSTSGFYNLVTRLTPGSTVNDLLAENNMVTLPIYIQVNNQALPKLKVLFDNKEIHDGDFVAPRPVISVEYPQNSIQKTAATYSASIDGKEINRTILGNAGDVVSASPMTANIRVTEQLGDGYHSLEIKQIGIQSAPVVAKLQFQVASKASIRDAFNYPNPFPANTVFTFEITGSQVPDRLRIKIYTVAGRIIRTLELFPGQLQIGLNRVAWDGRDDQGDEIANGTYFYKITMDSGQESADAIQRLVKMR